MDERPAMGSQPNLASRSEVMSTYKCPQTFLGLLPQIWGAIKTSNFDHFFATSAVDTAYLRNETSQRQTKILVSIYNISPKRWPTFHDLWPRNGWDPFRHCNPPPTIWKFSIFRHCRAFHTKATEVLNPGQLNFARCYRAYYPP